MFAKRLCRRIAPRFANRQMLPSANKMYVGAMTTPIMNQANTCSIINKAKILAIAALRQISIAGRHINVKPIVRKVAIRLAGIRKAQIPIQLLLENTVKVLKFNINYLRLFYQIIDEYLS